MKENSKIFSSADLIKDSAIHSLILEQESFLQNSEHGKGDLFQRLILIKIWVLLVKYDTDGNLKIDDRDKQNIKDDIYNGDKDKQDIIDYTNFVDEWKDSVPFTTKKVQNALYIHDIDPNNPKSQIIDVEKWIFDNSDEKTKDTVENNNENDQN